MKNKILVHKHLISHNMDMKRLKNAVTLTASPTPKQNDCMLINIQKKKVPKKRYKAECKKKRVQENKN